MSFSTRRGENTDELRQSCLSLSLSQQCPCWQNNFIIPPPLQFPSFAEMQIFLSSSWMKGNSAFISLLYLYFAHATGTTSRLEGVWRYSCNHCHDNNTTIKPICLNSYYTWREVPLWGVTCLFTVVSVCFWMFHHDKYVVLERQNWFHYTWEVVLSIWRALLQNAGSNPIQAWLDAFTEGTFTDLSMGISHDQSHGAFMIRCSVLLVIVMG